MGFDDFESRADGVGKLESLVAETPERWSIAVIAALTDEPGAPIQSIRDGANRRSQNSVL
jgi:hypothetical protein